MSLKPTSVPTKRLAQSIISTDMAFQLDDILGWDNANLSAADFGTQGYCVFRNAARTQIELMEFDPSTVASSSITIVRRGLDFSGDLTTEYSDYKFDWTAGDTFVDLGTDTPQLFQWMKEYIDAASIAGMTQPAFDAFIPTSTAYASTIAKGIVELATSSEVNAGSATGGTGAGLVVTPDALKASQIPIILDYLAADSPATWTKPTGLKYLVVECQGAGGNGATDGASGGAGGYTKKIIAAASLGSTETVTIGAGGVGSGNTSFGSLLTAGNGGNASGDTPGTAGAATTGDVNVPGQAGCSGNAGAGYGGNDGGDSFMGFGGRAPYNTAGTTVQNGESASGFGGGGAGGQKASDGSPSGGTGGGGTSGIVIVTEFYV